MTTNQINWHALGETTRANQAREMETHRANLAQEALLAKHYDEEQRSNKAREKETHRANRAAEKENKRSNKAAEKENKRWHKSTVREQRASRRENTRANKAREAIDTANTGLTEKKIMLEAASRDQANKIQAMRNLQDYTAKKFEARLKRGQLDATLATLKHQVENDNSKLKLEQRQQNLVTATSMIQTLARYLTDRAKQKTVDAKTAAEIKKLSRETAKLDLENELKEDTLTAEKINKNMSVIGNLMKTAEGVVKDIIAVSAYK